MDLDLGLEEDDWNSIAANLLKDFNKNIRNATISQHHLDSANVNLGDFLSELQTMLDERKREQALDDNSVSCKKLKNGVQWLCAELN